MSEFSDMLERVKFNSIIGYLMYGTEDSVVEDRGTYEERIKNAYDKIFGTLEDMFPSANKDNDKLFGAVMDFSITHNKVYLEMGIIVGIQMYKNLEQQPYLDLTNIQTIIKDMLSADMKRENANEWK